MVAIDRSVIPGPGFGINSSNPFPDRRVSFYLTTAIALIQPEVYATGPDCPKVDNVTFLGDGAYKDIDFFTEGPGHSMVLFPPPRYPNFGFSKSPLIRGPTPGPESARIEFDCGHHNSSLGVCVPFPSEVFGAKYLAWNGAVPDVTRRSGILDSLHLNYVNVIYIRRRRRLPKESIAIDCPFYGLDPDFVSVSDSPHLY